MADLIINGEIHLSGPVVDDEWAGYYDGGVINPAAVAQALSQFPSEVTIHLNSGGGDPFQGEAIRAAIAGHEGETTLVIAGVAASAASLIAMGADNIEMTQGSTMMIHEPSTITWGNAAAHLDAAEFLETLSDIYAKVYASRSGMDLEELRTKMAKDWWFGAEDAVALGFADSVHGDEPETNSSEFDMSAVYDTAIEALRMGVQHFGQSPVTMALGKMAATPVIEKDLQMPDGNATPVTPVATPVSLEGTPPEPTPTPEPTQQVDVDAVAMAAVTGERQRTAAIRAMAQPHLTAGVLEMSAVDQLIADGVTADAAGVQILSLMASNTGSGNRQSVQINRDETETQMEGMIGALMGQRDGAAAQYAGMRLRSLATHLAPQMSGFNQIDMVRSGMRSVEMRGGAHGLSDFAYITTEVMNRSLMAEYERRMSAWNRITGTPIMAADFRELNPVRFGGDFMMKTVTENGEYEEANLTDEAEGLKAVRKGRTINLTFEAVVNDDMGAFSRIPRQMAIAASVMEASTVWSLIRSNAALKSDGEDLFSTAHSNLAAASGAISVTTVGAARKTMWEQTAFGSEDPDDFLMVEPNLLVVPPALEVSAAQFVTQTTPNKTADVNPYTGSLEPMVVPHLGASAGGSDAAWYLFSSDHPPVSVVYLEGYQNPTIQSMEGMNPDKMSWTARHIFGAAATEFRGSYKNP